MKPEKEVLWMVNLLKSKFVKKKFGFSIGGYKSEFEKVAKASESNKEFRKWFDKLVEDGTIEIFEKKSIGKGRNFVNTYVIDVSKLYKKLKEIELAKNLLKMGAEKESALGF